jgi:hypothetical protein
VSLVARFAFVSGSETSAEAWTPVLDRLREFGHRCCIHGLDQIAWAHGAVAGVQALADRISGERRIEDQQGLDVNQQTILVGHSLAGLFLPSFGEWLGAATQV